MPAAERKLDVWIVDLKKVYTGVPFTVVTDWLQQGRLLATDRVRIHGKEKWHTVDAVPALKPYLPKPIPHAAEDRAEAMAEIDLGLQPVKVHEGEDDDVDMIPLIDVSLVLLIFFMMTTAITAGVFSSIPTPEARHQLATISGDMYWIGIEIDKEDKTRTLYSLGKDSEKSQYLVPPAKANEDEQKNYDDVFAALRSEFDQVQGEVKVRLRADKRLPIEAIKSMTLDLQELEARLNQARAAANRIQIVVLGEVSEPTK